MHLEVASASHSHYNKCGCALSPLAMHLIVTRAACPSLYALCLLQGSVVVVGTVVCLTLFTQCRRVYMRPGIAWVLRLVQLLTFDLKCLSVSMPK